MLYLKGFTMISYLIQECSYNLPPKICVIGDVVFAILVITMLIFIIWNLYKVGVEKDE